jgi:hypothetical protein
VASTAPHEAGTDAASPQPAADATNTTAVVDGHDGGDMNGSGEGEGESEQLTEEDAAFLEEDDGPSGLAEAMAAADKEPAPQLLSIIQHHQAARAPDAAPHSTHGGDGGPRRGSGSGGETPEGDC